MREIKFRVFDEQDGMCEVYSVDKIYIRYNNSSEDMIQVGKLSLDIMQYSNIDDINGKEIYEGDIIRDDDEDYSGVVEFRDGGFMTDARGYGNDYLREDDYFEVIGNIYENPELLKG